MNRIFILVKVCREEWHREGFLDGRLFMNTLGYFRRYEDVQAANIADRHEGTAMVLQPGQHTMTFSSPAIPGGSFTIPATGFAAPSTVRPEEFDFLNVFCMYAAHEGGHELASDEDFARFVDAQLMRPEVDGLGAYSAVVVDPKVFQERTLQAVRMQQADRQYGFEAWAGLVDYYDSSSFHGSFEGERAVFNKRKIFDHQREYRLALDQGLDVETDYTLDIGSLRDIAYGCRTSEVNELIRKHLYQMRDQGAFG